MKLYYDPRTVNCRKVVAGFKLMGVDFESANVDYFAQGQKEPEYLAINPNGALPALTDGGLVLWESNAILQYGADKAGAESAYPRDLATRADCQSLAPLGSERLVPDLLRVPRGERGEATPGAGAGPGRPRGGGARTSTTALAISRYPGSTARAGSAARANRPSPTSPSRRRCTFTRTRSSPSIPIRTSVPGWGGWRPCRAGRAPT